MFKRCFEISTLIVLILFFMVSSVFAFPNFINYQGKLTDPSGNLLNGEYLLTFKIYSVETWGSPLWTEEQLVMVTNGIYNAELGTVNPFPANLFETARLYLEVIIFNTDTGTDETLSPRIPVNATGFSMKAKKVDSVAWQDITGKPAGFADNTDNVNDADADPGNELQALGTSGNSITLSKGGGSITVPYATYANNADMVDGKHASELINDADADPGNEIQTLGTSGNTITLSKGGGSITVPYATYANNADMVDGKHASELGGGDGHSLDAADGSPVDALYVNNAGNVGIGTTSPKRKLHILGRLRLEGSSDGPEIEWRTGTSRHWNIDQYGSAADLRFFTEASDDSPGPTRVTFKENGNVGIGTTSPDSKLHVFDFSPQVRITHSGSGGKTLALSAGAVGTALSAGAGSPLIFRTDSDLIPGYSSNERMRISTSGNVGIGTDSPSQKLDVRGNVIANNYYNHSDSRLKRNITSIYNALDKVLSLSGVEFEWRVEEYPEKGFTEGRKIGLIAQDVEKVIPEVVSIDNEGYKSVEYANIVSVLIEAIKAQQAQIEELKARIEVLE